MDEIFFSEVTNINDTWYPSFYAIYSTAFPVHEQRNRQQQIEAFSSKNYHLDVWIENGKLQSFIAYWEFDTFIYIEHFAVDKELRGQHIGSKTLISFAGNKKKVIILEIDPLIDEISRKRFSFYEKTGFRLNPFKHFHPPYRKEYPPHELLVLSYPESINEELYNEFYDKLSGTVMK